MDSGEESSQVNYRWLFEHPLESFFIATLKRHLMDGWTEYSSGLENLLKARKEPALLFTEYIEILGAYDSRKPRHEIISLARSGFGDLDPEAPGTFQDKALFVQVYLYYTKNGSRVYSFECLTAYRTLGEGSFNLVRCEWNPILFWNRLLILRLSKVVLKFHSQRGRKCKGLELTARWLYWIPRRLGGNGWWSVWCSSRSRERSRHQWRRDGQSGRWHCFGTDSRGF